jgi:hypothetical protein
MQDGEGTAADWHARALTAESSLKDAIVNSEDWKRRAERAEANLIDSQARVRQLTGDVSELATSNDKRAKYIDDLQRRLALAEQRRAEAEKNFKECHTANAALRAVQADEEPPEFPEFYGLPERFSEVLGTALEAFAEGYREYGPGAADELGLAGQWGDLHRKVGKLKRSLWQGNQNLTREDESAILNDIVGHCLLALDMLRRGFEGGR